MTEPVVHLTPQAVENATKQLAKRGTPDAYLRLGIKGGACSGFEHILLFDEQKRERDYEFKFDTLKVLVDFKSMVILSGTVLDYERSLMKSGFKFINPSAISTCGCGKSFDVKAPE